MQNTLIYSAIHITRISDENISEYSWNHRHVDVHLYNFRFCRLPILFFPDFSAHLLDYFHVILHFFFLLHTIVVIVAQDGIFVMPSQSQSQSLTISSSKGGANFFFIKSIWAVALLKHSQESFLLAFYILLPLLGRAISTWIYFVE